MRDKGQYGSSDRVSRAFAAVLVASAALVLFSCSAPKPAQLAQRSSISYSTAFPLTEDPLSESGRWVNGGSSGAEWANVRTTPEFAFGTEGANHPAYDDSTAILAGTWGPNQRAEAAVRSLNQQSGGVYEEVELRLRTVINRHRITGYEINFRCVADGSQYVQIVRWNGPLGSFHYVANVPGPGIHNGDVVMATVIGHTIRAYINGAQVVQGADSAFAAGNPGIGFYLQGGAPGLEGDYGFTSFSATDLASGG
jgi:hypothetical protein